MTAGRLLGVSEAWQAVDRQIAELSLTCEVALIHGASGVGSETVAREIHRRSDLAGEFVVVNAACFPPGLLEPEILGEGGALALAAGGTLLVKCIEDSVEAQRVTAAAIRTSGTTARFLLQAYRDRIDETLLLPELRSRIERVIRIPTLRERREDIPLLVRHFLDEFGGDAEIEPEVMDRLCSYGWPGNVRELYCRVMAAHARRRGRLIDRLVFGPPC